MEPHLDGSYEQAHAVERLIEGYRPLAGVFDEMMDAAGRPRPHWRPLLAQLAVLGTDEIGRRFAAADRHLRDSGVFYRGYEDPSAKERAWPLCHVPLLIHSTEWQALRAGVIERARLLEAVLADVYGPGQLVREGRLPSALIAGNPEFLRPLVGVAPRGGAHLRFCAVDLGRGPDGRWWVLGDRAQAPSGAGYTLENRLALSRAIPEIYRRLNVERLAPFFHAFQSDLAALNSQERSRVCLLTPGAMSETYFEHAYLARYLGFELVEGEDLSVRENGVFIRTVSGLKRVEVLVRRLDADFADPLELNARSRLGVAGLVQAVRDGQIVIANALGSGLVEARALLSFLPALAHAVNDADLRIPNVATWWLGQPTARAEVIGKLDSMVIGSAFSTIMSGYGEAEEVLGATLSSTQRARLLRDINFRGVDFVAQEAVHLSTMPVWRDGALRPYPFILRLFLAKVGEGWQVMPGGFVRIADDLDARAVSLQRGGRTADAWVLSDGPIAETTLLPNPDHITIRRDSGATPSRAADNLFWVARYAERAEATLRVVRALVNRTAEADDSAAHLVARIGSLLGAWSAVPTDIPGAKPVLLASAALQRHDLDGALPALVGSARFAASMIRDRFSPDAWRALADLVAVIEPSLPSVPSEAMIIERVNAALRIIAAFSGLAQENMNQRTGWRFLELGRRIERAIATCRFVRHFAGDPTDGTLDVLLELADSQITYRRHYLMIPARAPVIDLVVLDPGNPRSIAFQLDRVESVLAALPRRHEDGRPSLPQRIAIPIAAALRSAAAPSFDDALIGRLEADMLKLSDAVAATYLTHYERRAPSSEMVE
jgi:uncharacterized circularly permuted ATP-grasp superfamily protein/uncharacterized alpha-E superfamily protein